MAQNVEQSNVNDLASLIEHGIFKTELEKIGLLDSINLVGDMEKSAEARRGEVDSQADAINFARAVLEYQKHTDVNNLRKIYQRNNWQKSLQIGQEIADAVSRAEIKSPAEFEAVFLHCAAKLYPTPRPLKLRADKSVTAYRLKLIGF